MEKSQALVAVMMMLLLLQVSSIRFKSMKSVTFCNLTEDDLTTCKPSVTKANPVDPTAGCCTALAKANLTCLCSYKNSMFMTLYGVDPDLAMQLPVKCNLSPTPITC